MTTVKILNDKRKSFVLGSFMVSMEPYDVRLIGNYN
jgi:hypothetical protein